MADGALRASALALGVALMARDRQGPRIAFLMPIYPMIDDRNESTSSEQVLDIGIWDRSGNLEAWQWYLGGKEADEYAAPARAQDLSGLPPTFIDVGSVDLFRDEDIAFASRLMEAGVPTELHVNPGSYHAFETFAPEAALSQRIWAMRLDALRRGLQ
ncbi:MAG: alpha/beta hydrolase fold domain-containing protein [Humibacillus sp.]